mmetsp:Transcript_29041/g.51958  ORF Transcript_29041/g.51958 Transcript_29041/m.51958 type:complete len:330 (+) Transcript_29041:1024-2013(+)
MSKSYLTCFFFGNLVKKGVIAEVLRSDLVVEPRLRLITASTVEELVSSPHWGQIEILIPFVQKPELVSAVMNSNPIKWVHSFSAGVDRLLIPEIIQTDVPFTNARGAYNLALKEYVITAILHFEKQVQKLMECKAARNWDMFYMSRASGKRLGILGYGSIGRDIAQAAKLGLGMEIVAIKKRSTGSVEFADEVHLSTDLHSVLPTLDYLAMCLPATPDTDNIIGEPEIRLMKPSAVIINIGRGNAVEEGALSTALHEGRLKGAALDVYKIEPLPADHFLWETPRLLMSYHNADFTEDLLSLSIRTLMRNFNEFYQGKPLVTPVDKQAGY